MKKILAICNNPDESRGHYTMLSKSDRERQILYDLTHIYNLKKKKNNQQTKTDSPIQRTSGCQRGGTWGRKR